MINIGKKLASVGPTIFPFLISYGHYELRNGDLSSSIAFHTKAIVDIGTVSKKTRKYGFLRTSATAADSSLSISSN